MNNKNNRYDCDQRRYDHDDDKLAYEAIICKFSL